jgi:hypothetical protein
MLMPVERFRVRMIGVLGPVLAVPQLAFDELIHRPSAFFRFAMMFDMRLEYMHLLSSDYKLFFGPTRTIGACLGVILPSLTVDAFSVGFGARGT